MPSRSSGLRMFLFVLMCAAGVSSLPPEASAQNRNTFRNGAGLSVSVSSPPALLNVTGSQTISIQSSLPEFTAVLYTFFACTRTETPRSWDGAYTNGCTPLGTGVGDKTLTVTQAMIDNGGVVIAMRETAFAQRLRFAQWVPISARGIVVSTRTLAVTEEGEASYTVRLSHEPTGDVYVEAARPENSRAIEIFRPGSFFLAIPDSWQASYDIYFTPTTWNTAVRVRVRALADADAADVRTTITHAIVPRLTVADYHNAATQTLAVTVRDDETAAIVVSERTLAVTEQAEAAYTVRLSAVPTETVWVRVQRSSSALEIYHPGFPGIPGGWTASRDIYFTATDWNTAVTVRVRAPDDADTEDARETITHTVLTGNARWGQNTTVRPGRCR